MRYLFIILFLCFTWNVEATTITTPTTWGNGDSVTAAKLNGNQAAITNVVNGHLDNTNADTTSGYHFFQSVAALPAAGNQGAVDFLTSDNSLNLDSGSAWLKTITPTGTLAIGQIPYYSSGWALLSPGAQYYSIVSNGTSSLPSFQQVDLTSGRGATGTLAIANGGTGQVTAQAAVDALLPSQASANGKFLTSNGSASSWGTPSISLVSATTITAASTSGNIAIVQGNKYLVVLQAGIIATGSSQIVLQFNADSGNHYAYALSPTTTTDSQSSIFMTAASAISTSTGPTSAHFIIDTLDLTSNVVWADGDIMFPPQGGATQAKMNHFFGYWNNAVVTSFVVTEANGHTFTGKVYLYKYSLS